jgi:signal peptidase I
MHRTSREGVTATGETARPETAGGGGGGAAHMAPAAPRRRRRGLIEWAIIIVVALLAAFLIRNYLVESYVVPTPSMFPTIKDGDRILVNKLSFDFGHHARAGEIVVFNKPPADISPDTPVLVKRVIGLPGQTLRSGPHGEIFVDNKLMSQPWLTAAAKADPGPTICQSGEDLTDCRGGSLYLPANTYYMMGDNRGDSDDSRYWGPVSGSLFIGRAFVRIWPLNRLHWF